jgi:hypothetical protein
MANEQSQAELTLLQKDQRKARQDEVFGGLSPVERAEYNWKAERIHTLERDLQVGAVADKQLLSEPRN